MTDDFRLAFFPKLVVSRTGQHAAPGHDHNDVTDVGDIRNGPQRMVHHDLLQEVYTQLETFHTLREYLHLEVPDLV